MNTYIAKDSFLSTGFCRSALTANFSTTAYASFLLTWGSVRLQLLDIQRFPPIPKEGEQSRFYLAASDGESLIWVVVPPNTNIEQDVAQFHLDVGCVVTLLKYTLLQAKNGFNVVVVMGTCAEGGGECMTFSPYSSPLIGAPTWDHSMFTLSSVALLTETPVAAAAATSSCDTDPPPPLRIMLLKMKEMENIFQRCVTVTLNEIVRNPTCVLSPWKIDLQWIWVGTPYSSYDVEKANLLYHTSSASADGFQRRRRREEEEENEEEGQEGEEESGGGAGGKGGNGEDDFPFSFRDRPFSARSSSRRKGGGGGGRRGGPGRASGSNTRYTLKTIAMDANGHLIPCIFCGRLEWLEERILRPASLSSTTTTTSFSWSSPPGQTLPPPPSSSSFSSFVRLRCANATVVWESRSEASLLSHFSLREHAVHLYPLRIPVLDASPQCRAVVLAQGGMTRMHPREDSAGGGGGVGTERMRGRRRGEAGEESENHGSSTARMEVGEEAATAANKAAAASSSVSMDSPCFPIYPVAAASALAAGLSLSSVSYILQQGIVGQVVSFTAIIVSVCPPSLTHTKRGSTLRASVMVADPAQRLAVLDITLWGEAANFTSHFPRGQRCWFHRFTIREFQRKKNVSSRVDSICVFLSDELVLERESAPMTGDDDGAAGAGMIQPAVEEVKDILVVEGMSEGACHLSIRRSDLWGNRVGCRPAGTCTALTTAATPPPPFPSVHLSVSLSLSTPMLPALARIQEVDHPLLWWQCSACRECSSFSARTSSSTPSPDPSVACPSCKNSSRKAVLRSTLVFSDGNTRISAMCENSALEVLLDTTAEDLREASARMFYSLQKEGKSTDHVGDLIERPLCASLSGSPVLVWLFHRGYCGLPPLVTRCCPLDYRSSSHVLLSLIEGKTE